MFSWIRPASCCNPRCGVRGHHKFKFRSIIVGTATTAFRRPALSPSPLCRSAWGCAIASSNHTGDEVFTFVQQLRSHRKRPLRVIWERFSGHTKAACVLHDLYGHRVQVAFLPAYAPEVNVVEQGWGQTKYGELAHFIPEHVDDLAQAVAHSLRAKPRRPALLRF